MTTYYIATSQNGGSNANAGTSILAPRLTVPSTLNPGDTVYFRGGNYFFTIDASHSGSSGSPITYQAYDGEDARIYGANLATSLFSFNGKSWIDVADLWIEFHKSLTELRSGANNQVRTNWVNVPAASQHCNITGCTIHKTTVSTIADAIHDYDTGHRENGILVSGDYVTIADCFISGMNKGIRSGDGVRARDLWIKDNHIYLTAQSCIMLGRTDGNSRGALIEDNTFEKSVMEDGIQFFVQRNGPMTVIGHCIRNNKFIDCGENSIDFKGVSRCVIEGNIFRGTVGSNNGWKNTGSDSPNRNTFSVFGQGAETDSERIIIRNNVFYDNCSGPAMKDSEHRKHYHNVIHTNRRDYTGPLSTWPGTNGVEFLGLKQPSAGANYMVFVNNIVGGHKPDGQVALFRNAADTRIDGNLYFTENGTARNIWMTGSTSWTAYGFAAWKAFLANQATIIGGDANSQWLDGNADVDFVNVPAEPVGDDAEFDFRVNVTSPAYHAGLPLAYALNSGSSSTNLKVDDPYMFSDGMGSGLYGPDTIFVGGTEVDIAGIDYATGIITLDTAISWDVGDGITWGSATPNIGLVDDVSGGTYVIADFTGTPLSGTAPLSVTFTDASSASSSITVYSWKRNDGTGWVEFSTSASPAGVSFAAGSWSVRLTITTADGTNTKTHTNYIISSDSGGETPNPSDNNQMVNGDFASGDLTNWKWYCNGAGDSAYVESGEFVANVPDKGSNTQLWYQEEAGASGISVVQGRTYVFRFKVRAGTSSTSDLSADVLQNASPYNDLGLSQSFTANTSQETKEFVFVATASYENVRARVRWTGDIAQNLYFDDFEFFEQVALTVTFDTDVTPAGEAPRAITFTDTSAGASPIASRVWKVNGMQVSTAESFSYTFASGAQTVSLTVTDTSGNSGTASTTFTVTAPSTGGTAGVNVTVARAASNTSGGSSTQTIALDGLSDVPNFVMLICSSAASDGVAADHARLSIGFCDGTNQAGHAVSSESGLATTKTRRVGSGSAIYLFNGDTAAVVGEAAITDVAIDEITLTWATLPASAFLITVVAGVFDNVAVTDVTQPAENSTTTVNTLGFTPTLLLAVTAFETMDETSSTALKFSMGFVTASFAGGIGLHENDSEAAGAPKARLGADYAIYQTQQGALDLMQADVQIVSGGFSYQTLDNAGLGVTTIVAIDTGSAGVDAQVVTTPTSTGAANLYGSGLAFAPGLILGLATWRGAIDADGATGATDGDAGAWGVLAAVDGAAYSTAWAAEVGSATTDTQSLADDQFLNLPDDSGANAITATAGAFTSDNVPLTWGAVDATGRKMLVVAIGLIETEAAAGATDFFERGIMVGTRPGMP